MLFASTLHYNVWKTVEAFMFLARRHGHPKYRLSCRKFLIQGPEIHSRILILALHKPQARDLKCVIILEESVYEHYSSPSKKINSWYCPACFLFSILFLWTLNIVPKWKSSKIFKSKIEQCELIKTGIDIVSLSSLAVCSWHLLCTKLSVFLTKLWAKLVKIDSQTADQTFPPPFFNQI